MTVLIDGIKQTPRIFNQNAADRLIENLRPHLGFADANVKALLHGIGGASPYLSRLLTAKSDILHSIFNSTTEEVVANASAKALTLGQDEEDAHAMARLRDAKAEAALAIALAEISGARSTMACARAWSEFADAAVNGAMRVALKNQMKAGRFSPLSVTEPELDCGLTILAMGKHGAHELNYSSDIDLIALFDPEATPLGGPEQARTVAVNTVRLVCQILQAQTRDGYVFRTDLRLRPDPGVSAAAVSIGAAELYYEAYGQNWERAAYIKARAAAGDLKLGETFIARLSPFVWRRSLDFAAIDDVNSIAQQLYASKGGAEVEFAGHDIKTGVGGIRNIEFLVQTRQLILGGRHEQFRQRATLTALAELEACGHFSSADAQHLRESYIFLRRVEHRLQMINDEQTHRIPSENEDIERLAAFLGENDVASFRAHLTSTLTGVKACFDALFDPKDKLSVTTGPLSFTGVEDHKETLCTLSEMGFQRAERISAALRNWHAGGVRATRTPRARELLTRLTPHLLQTLSAASDPDDAFGAFEGFIGQLPHGVQIFSLLTHAPQIAERLITIMTIAPFLRHHLVKHRELIESLLETPWPDPPAPCQALLRAMKEANDAEFEDKLNTARRVARNARFHIAAQLVTGALDISAAERGFTEIAEAAILFLLDACEQEISKQHGAIDGEICIIGFGRLGAQTMTADSDLDLVAVYNADPLSMSDGDKPLDAVTYYSRLIRRLITALSVQTDEGALYDIDMALRPSGRAGPVAVSLKAFATYYEKDAWTWERMALTKARVVAGDQNLTSRVGEAIKTTLTNRIEVEKLVSDIVSMRTKLYSEKKSDGVWDVKHITGGLTDTSFALQFLQLRAGHIFDWNTAYAHAENDDSRRDLEELADAEKTYSIVLQTMRAASGRHAPTTPDNPALMQRLVAALGAASFEEAEMRLAEQQARTAATFARVVGAAAAKTRDE